MDSRFGIDLFEWHFLQEKVLTLRVGVIIDIIRIYVCTYDK
jgi:hypothetical protein